MISPRLSFIRAKVRIYEPTDGASDDANRIKNEIIESDFSMERRLR
jgi:hypothetical protein